MSPCFSNTRAFVWPQDCRPLDPQFEKLRSWPVEAHSLWVMTQDSSSRSCIFLSPTGPPICLHFPALVTAVRPFTCPRDTHALEVLLQCKCPQWPRLCSSQVPSGPWPTINMSEIPVTNAGFWCHPAQAAMRGESQGWEWSARIGRMAQFELSFDISLPERRESCTEKEFCSSDLHLHVLVRYILG